MPWLESLRSRWWALIPALSIVVVVAVIELDPNSATWLSYLALVAVPPLAAYALGALIHGTNTLTSPFLANSATKGEVSGWGLPVVVAAALFALAWAAQGSLTAEAAATALSGLACIALGWLLVSVVPALWLRLGIYAMAALDTWFVASDLLQGPNALLSAAAPGSGLPSLQAVHFGAAQMGFGDLFIAALTGCLRALPADGPKTGAGLRFSARRQWVGAGLVAGLALGFDLLFFAVDELPATVPVAVALAVVQRLATSRTTGPRLLRHSAGPRG
ncbi:MAG TPA: hypothetical protein VHR65_07525 [Solirubrobacterales bacterium]|nr:hypothetical protein [Solirubrobacterales bacterium]